MKQMVNPTILTHIWKNSCTAGSNQLLAYFFAEFAIFLHPSSCHAWWNAILNGLHKYFWMEHTNTLLACTIFHFHRKNPTILAIAEKRILAQNTNIFIDWVAQIILVWQIKNYFCSSCLPNAMQFQRRYKSKITENTNRWIRRKNNCNPDLARWINPNISLSGFGYIVFVSIWTNRFQDIQWYE